MPVVTTVMLVVLVTYLGIQCAEILDHLPLFMPWVRTDWSRAICREAVSEILLLREHCSLTTNCMEVHLSRVFIFTNVYAQQSSLLLKANF